MWIIEFISQDLSELFESFYQSYVKIILDFFPQVAVSPLSWSIPAYWERCISVFQLYQFSYLVLCNQLPQNLKFRTNTICFSHDFACQQFELVSSGQLFLPGPHHLYICCQLEGNSWGWLVYDALSGKARIDGVCLVCSSPAGTSELVHMASGLCKQPGGKLNTQAIFKSALASCLLWSFCPEHVLKPSLFKW